MEHFSTGLLKGRVGNLYLGLVAALLILAASTAGRSARDFLFSSWERRPGYNSATQEWSQLQAAPATELAT